MREKLRASDYRFIAICLALLAGTTWYSVRNFYRAFPEASIDFRANRDDARHLAERFLAGQGNGIAGYRQASSFSFDDDAKTFLEREAGIEKANQLMSSRVRMWRWSYRWFRPQQKEEFRVDITPTGEFAGFAHELAEDAARPGITAEQARSLAEDFLRAQLHRDPATLEFVETSSATRPNRVDQTFTWKERDFNLHDGTIRLEVTVLGNEVGGYREYLKIPEKWTRDYERLRSKNNEAQTFDTAVMLALLIGLVVVIVMRLRRHDVRWRRAALIGLAGMVLSFLASLNEFPLSEFGYPTTDAYSSFVMRQMLQALLSALGAGGLLFVVTAGAEAIYREAFPGQISLGGLVRPRGLRTKRFFLGAILGITLTGIFIAYQTIFYIVAYRYGAWSPADVPYSDLLNTRFPWLFVLFGGFFPAISEEFIFRMFAIPFLRKLARALPVAIVLAGFIWGFGHAGYPQQPFFIRGLEVGIGGVALGCIMLRWGILPTLVWHYSVDAMYSAMLLMRSHSLYFKLSGAASAGIIVLPVVVALAAYWVRGGFEPESGLLNADEPPPAEVPEAAPEPAAEGSLYQRMSGRARFSAIAILVLGLLSLLIPVSHFGESPRFKLTAEQARAPADAFLRTLGADPGTFRYVTYPEVHWGSGDSLVAKYFLERQPVTAAAKLFEQFRPVQHWATRYFKSLDKEEFLVTVQPETGKVMGFNHQIPEDRPGADISADAARATATQFASTLGVDVGAMDLKESQTEKRKARRDYALTWEALKSDPRNLDEAHFRVSIGIAGDRVSSFRSYWKIPEAFERSRSQQNFISISVLALEIAAIAGTVVFGIFMLVRNIRRGLVPWRKALWLAVVPTVLTLVSVLLNVHVTLYRGYQTAIPFETFAVMTYTILGMSVLFAFVMYGAGMALLTSFFPDCLAALRAAARRVMALDAALALLAAAGLDIGYHRVGAWLMDHFHAQALLQIDAPSLIGNSVPALAALAGAARSVFAEGAALAIVALVVGWLPRRWLLLPAALLAAFTTVSDEVHTPAEFALEYGVALIGLGCAVAFCVWFARKNYLAYALVFGALALRDPLVELLGSGNQWLQTQGWIVAAVLAVGMVATMAPLGGRPSRSTRP